MEKRDVLPIISAIFIGLSIGSVAFATYGLIQVIWNYSEYWTNFTLTSLLALTLSVLATYIIGNIIEDET